MLKSLGNKTTCCNGANCAQKKGVTLWTEKNDLQRNKHEENTQTRLGAGAKGQQGAVKQNQRPSRDDETRIEGTDNFAEKKKQTEGELTETHR